MYLLLLVLYPSKCAIVQTTNTHERKEVFGDGFWHASVTGSMSKNILNKAAGAMKADVNLKTVAQSEMLKANKADHLKLIRILLAPVYKTKYKYLTDSDYSDEEGKHTYQALSNRDRRKYLHSTPNIEGKNGVNYIEKPDISEKRYFGHKLLTKQDNNDHKLERISNMLKRHFNTSKHKKSNENHLHTQSDFAKTNLTVSYGHANAKHNESNLVRRDRSVRKETHTSYNRTETVGTQSSLTCNIALHEESKTIFHSQLYSREPNFIQFSLSFYGQDSVKPTFTDDVFMGLRWFWTYNTSAGPYPFLSWNLDYGILSFHLLESGTINVPNVCVQVYSPNPYFDCAFTFGKKEISEAVTNALIPLIDVKEGSDIIKYPESYFCYLSTRQDYRNTLHYWAAIYFYYPIRFVHYKCCSVMMNYTSSNYVTTCQDGDNNISGVHKWVVTTRLPYLLGIVFLMFFPIMLFNINAWLSKDETIHGDLTEFELTEDFESKETIDNDWIFADGSSPFTLGDLLSFKTIGLSRHPVIVSRLRRLLFVLSFPFFIYIQIAMYAEGMGKWSNKKIHVRDLVKVGTPMGFLAILGDAEDRQKVFVPILGGPLGVVILYYALSLLFIALPRSVKQVVETGLLTSNPIIKSPLFFGTGTIIYMSKINVKHYHMTPGYTKAATLMKCRFYMLFTREFWKQLWNIQVERIHCLLSTGSFCCFVLTVVLFLPFYVVFCVFEIVLCILYHGLPFCSFVSCMINGGLKSLRYLRGQSLILNAIFKNPIACVIGFIFMLFLYMVYIYVIFLVFIISLGFIFNVITHCFVAIIIYPSVSFGYLFFFIVLFYYFINLIRDFGDGYTGLLATTVDVSRHLSLDKVQVTVTNGHLAISNAQIESIVDVRINDVSLEIPPQTLRKIQTRDFVKIKVRDSTYGIPKKLFQYIVITHRPVHQQVINLCFKAIIMIAFVIVTLSVSADYVGGPTSEISEVMHVIFIVAVGALPQLVQAILSRSDTLLEHEIEEREIEKTIMEFWNKEETKRGKYQCTYGSI